MRTIFATVLIVTGSIVGLLLLAGGGSLAAAVVCASFLIAGALFLRSSPAEPKALASPSVHPAEAKELDSAPVHNEESPTDPSGVNLPAALQKFEEFKAFFNEFKTSESIRRNEPEREQAALDAIRKIFLSDAMLRTCVFRLAIGLPRPADYESAAPN